MRAGRGVVLTDEGLPLASGARVARELRVGLETELAVERRLDLALVAARAGEQRAAELGLDEELSVKDLWSRIEGCARNGGVDLVGGGDGVSREQPHDFEILEADVEHAGQDLVDSVCKRYQQCGCARDECYAYQTAPGRDRRARPEWHPCGQGGTPAEARRGTERARPHLRTGCCSSRQRCAMYVEGQGPYKSAVEMLWRAMIGF